MFSGAHTCVNHTKKIRTDKHACHASNNYVEINMKYVCSYQYEYIPVYDYHAGAQGMGCDRTVVVAFQQISRY